MNAFPECAGLELSAPQGGTQGHGFGLNAELIFGQHPLSGEGVSFRLGVKSGFLRLQLDGCAVVPGTRFAVRDRPATLQREVKREDTATDTTKAVGSVDAQLGFGSQGKVGAAAIGGAASGSRARERKTSIRHDAIEEIHRVSARGTNTEPSWEIRDPESPILDGRYLGQENLCEIAPQEDRCQITAQFVCRKRDLDLADLECTGWLRSVSTTKEKLALAVVARELAATPEDLGEGMLGLCRSRIASPVRKDDEDGDR